MKMDDIARLANVSKAAVSIALNNRPGVSDETRQRILEIAKQNNYVPSRRSRKSAAKPVIHFISISTDTLAVNRPTDLPFFANLLAEISVVTQAQNTSLQIESLSPAQISAWVASVDEDDSNYFGTMVLATALSKSDVLTFTRTLKKSSFLMRTFATLLLMQLQSTIFSAAIGRQAVFLTVVILISAIFKLQKIILTFVNDKMAFFNV